jgi:hypothetical protein
MQMTTQQTEEEKREERKVERELQQKGLVRVETYTANLALRAGIPVVRGPKVPGSATDRGLFVPAWVQWHLERFPQNDQQLRERQEELILLKDDKEQQLMLLLEANLCGATIYDPSGDIGTANALRILQEELGHEQQRDSNGI